MWCNLRSTLALGASSQGSNPCIQTGQYGCSTRLDFADEPARVFNKSLYHQMIFTRIYDPVWTQKQPYWPSFWFVCSRSTSIHPVKRVSLTFLGRKSPLYMNCWETTTFRRQMPHSGIHIAKLHTNHLFFNVAFDFWVGRWFLRPKRWVRFPHAINGDLSVMVAHKAVALGEPDRYR